MSNQSINRPAPFADASRETPALEPVESEAGDLTVPHVTPDSLDRPQSQRHRVDAARRLDKLHELSMALARADDRERRALAKDLHDDIGQMLAVLALKFWTIKKLNTSKELDPAIDDCAKVVAQVNDKLRAMALQLTPPLLDERGLAPMLRWLAEEMQRVYAIQVELHDDGLPMALDPVVSSALFRAVRELLLNVFRHSGVAHASIDTRHGSGNRLIVRVTDAGVGFDCESPGALIKSNSYGLLVIRERLGFLDGSLSIRSSPGAGTTVTMQVPLLKPDQLDSMKVAAP